MLSCMSSVADCYEAARAKAVAEQQQQPEKKKKTKPKRTVSALRAARAASTTTTTTGAAPASESTGLKQAVLAVHPRPEYTNNFALCWLAAMFSRLHRAVKDLQLTIGVYSAGEIHNMHVSSLRDVSQLPINVLIAARSLARLPSQSNHWAFELCCKVTGSTTWRDPNNAAVAVRQTRVRRYLGAVRSLMITYRGKEFEHIDQLYREYTALQTAAITERGELAMLEIAFALYAGRATHRQLADSPLMLVGEYAVTLPPMALACGRCDRVVELAEFTQGVDSMPACCRSALFELDCYQLDATTQVIPIDQATDLEPSSSSTAADGQVPAPPFQLVAPPPIRP